MRFLDVALGTQFRWQPNGELFQKVSVRQYTTVPRNGLRYSPGSLTAHVIVVDVSAEQQRQDRIAQFAGLSDDAQIVLLRVLDLASQ